MNSHRLGTAGSGCVCVYRGQNSIQLLVAPPERNFIKQLLLCSVVITVHGSLQGLCKAVLVI